MSPAVAMIIGFVLALAATIVMYVMVMPKKKDGQLSPFFQFLHNYFHFKQLYIEVVMKFMFALLTLTCIAGGFFMLFSSTYGQSFALAGFLLMILGPIVMRLLYEMSMMFILLVQNVIDINKKLKGEAPKANADPMMPVDVYQSGAWFCPTCGTRVEDGQPFCPNCGTRNGN